MKNYVKLLVFVLLFSSSAALAQSRSAVVGDDGAANIMLREANRPLAEAPSGDIWSVVPFNPTSNFTQEPVDGGCGTIDPYKPCYSGGSTEEICVKATSYTSCKSKCDCEFRKNKKKCNGGVSCIQLATTERDACYGNCLVDFA